MPSPFKNVNKVLMFPDESADGSGGGGRKGVLKNAAAGQGPAKQARLEGVASVSGSAAASGSAGGAGGMEIKDVVPESVSETPLLDGDGLGGAGGDGDETMKAGADVWAAAGFGSPRGGVDVETRAGGKGGNKLPSKEEEVSLSMLMKELRSINLSMNSKMTRFEQILTTFRSELQALKLEMVSKEAFQSLETRVTNLEQQGLPSPELSNLRQQISKLDPANKSLRFRGLTSENVSARAAKIETLLGEIGYKANNLEHVYKGPPGSRTLTDMCIVELASNNIRENALKELGKRALQELKVDRAKTAMQRQRNAALRKAEEMLKKNSTFKNKNIEIVWKKADPKDKAREVLVGGETAFRQTIDDVSGFCVPPFSFSV